MSKNEGVPIIMEKRAVPSPPWKGGYLNMKRKARIQTGIDDRLVAIYARKSRITNKGDSIGVQFKQSADYAINQLSLPEDYEFARYEDKGLSGYYSDRPDFQRLLRDIEMGKIKAVACYKLDRISRKTSDLMRLLEYFERPRCDAFGLLQQYQHTDQHIQNHYPSAGHYRRI